MKLLIKEHQESHENGKFCYICKINLKKNIWETKFIEKLEIIVIIQEIIEVLRIAYVK